MQPLDLTISAPRGRPPVLTTPGYATTPKPFGEADFNTIVNDRSRGSSSPTTLRRSKTCSPPSPRPGARRSERRSGGRSPQRPKGRKKPTAEERGNLVKERGGSGSTDSQGGGTARSALPPELAVESGYLPGMLSELGVSWASAARIWFRAIRRKRPSSPGSSPCRPPRLSSSSSVAFPHKAGDVRILLIGDVEQMLLTTWPGAPTL